MGLAEWHEAECHGGWDGQGIVGWNSAQIRLLKGQLHRLAPPYHSITGHLLFWVLSPTPYTLSLSYLIHSYGFNYHVFASDLKVCALNSKPTLFISTSMSHRDQNSICPNWTHLPLYRGSFFPILVNGITIYCCSRQKLGGYRWCFLLLHHPTAHGLTSHVVLLCLHKSVHFFWTHCYHPSLPPLELLTGLSISILASLQSTSYSNNSSTWNP